MPSPEQSLLRKIPSVDAVLNDPDFEQQAAGVPRRIAVDCLRAAIDQARRELLSGGAEDADQAALHRRVLALASQQIRSLAGPHYRKVVNATGIILHTGLGRAVLPGRALRQIQEELSGYSLLQADIQSGARSKRDDRIEWLLQQLTGAEAATVVNNNAAATMIVLNTLAAGREVVVSRGQLVEIGGSFRLPEVMAASGARLVEVGTTNKTHARDYQRAITENTAALMRVHPSNYKITGFTSEVPLEEMIEIAHARGLPLIDDVGAGALIDFSRFGFSREPTLPESVRAGADIVTASADKLIGGAQGGIILGRADLVRAVRANPLARIVRVGKLTLAALEATLSLFLDEALALYEVPTLRILCRDPADIAAGAQRIVDAVGRQVPGARIAAIDGFSQMGSGSLPTQNIPTRLVAVTPEGVGPDPFALRLRRHSPPVFARIRKDRVLLDPRTVLEGEEEAVIGAIVEALVAGG